MMAQRMVPSPDNYRAIYNEIAGIMENPAETFVAREFKSLFLQLPKETPAQQGLARQIDQALKNRDWESYRKLLADFLREHSGESGLAWGELIADFLQHWETRQGGFTQAKKRESLDRVLSTNGRNDELLFGRLQSLIRSWATNKAAGGDIEAAQETTEASGAPALPSTAPSMPQGRPSELLAELREAFVFTLETVVVAQLEDETEFVAQAKAFAAAVREATTLKSIQALLADIKRFAFSLEFIIKDRAELRAGLLRLLQLMIDNIGELVIDDHWMSGQIEIVREIIAQPMNLRLIHDTEQRLKEISFKQGQLKHSLVETKEALKQMLTGFVDHLADFADSTSDYHDKIEHCLEKIGQADDIAQLEDVLGETIREMRAIQLNAQRSRDDLRATRERVAKAEQRISELQDELDKASLLVRHDQLTGTLNRRGLDEIYENEVARAKRRRTPLCLALLDIDNFKRLNDSFGHDVGDAALIHLVSVVRETLRPQDTLARFGGE